MEFPILLQICGILAATLDSINAKGMVVGHTPQTAGANWYALISE